MIQKPKGTSDFFLEKADLFQYILDTFRKEAELFNYSYIQTPILEFYDLFYRSVGETTDVVSKEMFIFNDRSERKMALRPEKTAGVIRSLVENKLIFNAENKFYYYGSMFRYERPQKGRYREFTQIGCEWIEDNSDFSDFEILLFASKFLGNFNFNKVILKINNLGNKVERENYLIELKKYFYKFKDKFDEISLKRLEKNPLRILDDKEINHQDFIKNAPKLFDFLNSETVQKFNNLQNYLRKSNISFEIDYSLVRGFDYYNNLVFEFVYYDEESRSELTILGGGRYSNLIEELGGPKKDAIGFAAGVERLMILLKEKEWEKPIKTSIFVFNKDHEDLYKNFDFVYKLRKRDLVVKQNVSNFKLQKIYSKIVNEGIKFLIFFDEKLNQIIIKNLINKNFLDLTNKSQEEKINLVKKFIESENKNENNSK
ncbi:histidine--tRNA ligase [[Mycoplasma] mobile]|nr:histidine--tRNA ligase [[Mycoplasma] mobile]